MTFRVLAVCACLVVTLACGKKGNPLAPLRPVPARITDVAVARDADRVEIRFTVPAANLDGSTPLAIERVDIYGMVVAEAAPAPIAAVVVGNERHLRGRIAVRVVDEANPAPAVATSTPSMSTPGSMATFVDQGPHLAAPASRIYYVTVPVAGRNRRGPFSAPVPVALGDVPAGPDNVMLEHDERNVAIRWPATDGASDAFTVWTTTRTGDLIDGGAPLTVKGASAALPVVFGREVCVAVSRTVVAGSATLQGARSAPVCLTPVDKYPPAAPTGLQGVQEGTAVALVWNAVEAPDLGGYIVLRGAANAATLQPLVKVPLKETTFRDTTAQAGASYSYAVYAVDTATPANVSQLSARQTITVR